MEENSSWFPENWPSRTFLLCFKEFCATMVFFITYWRLQTFNDVLTLPLVLFTTVVLFSPAFLSVQLFAFLRTGPWFFSSSETTDTKRAVSVQMLQIGAVALAHLLGALAAGAMHKHLTRWYDDAAFVSGNQTVDSVRWRDSALEDGTTVFFDEFFAVTFMLVSVLHLMLATQESLIKKKPLENDRRKRGNNAEAGGRTTAIPVAFIAFACALVAGVARGFPAAHLSLGTSVFVCMVDGCTWRISIRILGGFMATLASVAYFHLFVLYLPTKDFWRARTVNAPPVYMQTLALPEHMRAAK
jgi:hypothetical protein